MTPERYEKAGRLYHAALEREPDARAAFLDGACGADHELRRDVESLLAAHDNVGNYFVAPALDVAAGILAKQQNLSLAGQSLSHYRVLSLIGAGGMGEVYLAEDTHLGRKVALKLLPKEFTQDQERVRRFEQEARAASALNHPNIVTIYEVGQVEGRHFIAIEYIEGHTLRERLASSAMALAQALDVSTQVSSALSAAHEAGVIHRDIKPENVMVRRDGLVKVLDFGLAKLAERHSERGGSEATTEVGVNTSPGVVVGTVTYMSPEQARGQQVDARTDMFSLGVLLYEMVAGRRPFEGETASDVIAAIIGKEPLPLARYQPEAPGQVQWIVNKALRKEREERYQSAKEMLSDLREVKQDLELKSKLERSESPEMSGVETIVQVARVSDEQATIDTANKPALRTDAAAARTTSSAEVILSEIKRHKRGAALIGLALILLLGGAGYGVYRLVSQPEPLVAPSRTMKVARLTTTGKAKDAAISPDGKYVVYVEEDAKQQSLWIRQVATGSNVQIVPLAQVEYFGLTFSKDSNYVYYVKVEESSRIFVLYRVPSLGGASKKLMEKVDSAITFSPDGQRFAFVREANEETYLMIANTDGAGERILATRKFPDHFMSMRVAWSPDGKIVACPVGDSSFYSVVGVSVEDGSEKPLTSQRWVYVEQVAWLSDGSGLVVLVAEEGSASNTNLWRISYPGGEVRRITNDLNRYISVSLTGDSDTLVTVQATQISSIWVAPKGDLGRASQITSGTTDGAGALSWTPDGKIVYRSLASGRSDIWIMNADGSNQRQLTHGDHNARSTVSPDGRYVVYTSRRADNVNIWRMDVDGSNPEQLTHGKGEANPHLSPDGRWVVYASFDRGYSTLWKVPIDGGDPVQLSETAANLPVVSPDGKHIACFYWDDQANPTHGVMIFPFEGGQPTKRLKISSPGLDAFVLKWTPDGRALTYIDAYLSNIWSQPIDGGRPVRLTGFQGEQLFYFDWSPDGKWLALARGRITRDVVLISDFR